MQLAIYRYCIYTFENHCPRYLDQLYSAGCALSYILRYWVCVMVFNATFNNISAMSWRSDLLLKETGVPEKKHRSVGSN